MEKQLLQRIYAKVNVDEDSLCFEYGGGTNGKGYGRMNVRGKMQSVHRVIYEIFFGVIPADKEINHRCTVRNCCNPAHLELVNHRENVSRTREYQHLRAERLTRLFNIFPQLELVGHRTVASTTLAALWNCRSDNVPDYLDTLAFLYEGLFRWQMVERGRGRKPSTFRIVVDPGLIEQLEEAEDVLWQARSDNLIQTPATPAITLAS